LLFFLLQKPEALIICDPKKKEHVVELIKAIAKHNPNEEINVIEDKLSILEQAFNTVDEINQENDQNNLSLIPYWVHKGSYKESETRPFGPSLRISPDLSVVNRYLERRIMIESAAPTPPEAKH